ILFQHFFLTDIFGNEISLSHGRRLSGPFGDEGVAGSFISKLFFLSFFCFYKDNLVKKFIFPIIILTIITVILTNERSASIMFLSGALIFFLFYKTNFFYKFTLFSFAILSIVILFNLNNNLKSHFIEIPVKFFKDNHHKAHFLASYEIFKDNKVFGSGIKTFRYICNEDKYSKINTKYASNRCATHPHNIYLEILSETGLLGFSIIILVNFYILFFLIFNFFKKNNSNHEILLLFSSFFILFWPLQTTGAFFSTWNGIFYWIFFSYFFYFKRINN
ncbi:MAG: O-antigen ligase family protein, partial [Pelagibacterales bacterium]|nr:O-antigen ligase family protein [Pelagibacterales bacterium]